MAQAIARCRRYRQEKEVHIYHFAALGTIDVDILEHRHKRVDAIFDADTTELPSIPPLQNKEKTRMVEIKGGMALVPKSWLEDKSIKKRLGITEEGKRFGSAIEFSETFRDDEWYSLELFWVKKLDERNYLRFFILLLFASCIFVVHGYIATVWLWVLSMQILLFIKH